MLGLIHLQMHQVDWRLIVLMMAGAAIGVPFGAKLAILIPSIWCDGQCCCCSFRGESCFCRKQGFSDVGEVVTGMSHEMRIREKFIPRRICFLA